MTGPPGALVTFQATNASSVDNGDGITGGNTGLLVVYDQSNAAFISANNFITINDVNNNTNYFEVLSSSFSSGTTTFTILNLSADSNAEWGSNANIALVGPRGPTGLGGGIAGTPTEGSYLAYRSGEWTSSGTSTSVALGYSSGTAPNGNNVVIGANAAMTQQAQSAIAIGSYAGQSGQGTGSIAIGANAGQTSQGHYAIAIGYNAVSSSQTANSIVLNASSSAFSAGASAFYVNPVRGVAVSGTDYKTLYYNTTTNEIVYDTS